MACILIIQTEQLNVLRNQTLTTPPPRLALLGKPLTADCEFVQPVRWCLQELDLVSMTRRIPLRGGGGGAIVSRHVCLLSPYCLKET